MIGRFNLYGYRILASRRKYMILKGNGYLQKIITYQIVKRKIQN